MYTLPTVRRFSYKDEEVSKRPGIFHTIKICLIESGNAVWNINGKDFPIHPGMVFLMGTGEHRYFKQIFGTLTMIICETEVRALLPAHRPLFINRPPNIPLFFHADAVSDFKTFLYAALEEAEKKEPFSQFYTEGFLSLALAALLRHFAPFLPATMPKMRPEVQLALQFIEKHITESISLEQIAEQVHLSPSALSKQFFKYNGIGFHQYITAKRVELAIKLLQTTDENVLDIAYACGFHNSAAFYDAFKKITGTTPLSYRASRGSAI